LVSSERRAVPGVPRIRDRGLRTDGATYSVFADLEPGDEVPIVA